MIKTLNVKDVEVGMYVILPWKLLRNPFASREYTIESEKQLEELREFGFREVGIDTSKSKIVEQVECMSHPVPEAKSPKEWNPTKNISKSLSLAIQDQALPPEEKAKAELSGVDAGLVRDTHSRVHCRKQKGHRPSGRSGSFR